jgi:phosphoribosylformimino-5-aminoimidazole carboxamide ribotide isomerase
MRIIPAIDIIEGKCVRLTKGAYDTKKIYGENPVEIAKKFEASGIEFLHLVDLDGAKSGHIVNYKVLETIAKTTNLEIDFGGGLKTDEDLKIAFENGATKITGGSIAVKNQMLFQRWISKYGSDKIILGADVRERKIAVSGWLETSDLDIFSFLADYQELGITDVICTDIAKDGTLEGPSFLLYEKIVKQFPDLNLIASGGVSEYNELVALKNIGCEGVIIGKAIYENKITLKELEKFIIESKVC